MLKDSNGKAVMESIMEKRAHRRLDVQLPIEYRQVGAGKLNDGSSTTINVSTGGVYFEIPKDDIKVGDELEMQLAVTSDDKRFPENSKIATVGEVIRTTVQEKQADKNGTSYVRYGIAAKFSQGFKLTL